MSYTYNLLKQLNTQRLAMHSSIYSRALDKQNEARRGSEFTPPVSEPPDDDPEERKETKNYTWLVSIAIVILLLLSFVLIYQLVMINKDKDAQMADAINGFVRIEKSLDDIHLQLNSASEELSKVKDEFKPINQKIESLETQIVALQKQEDAQNFAITNLIKAKDNLFNRVSDLAVELDKVKNQ